MLMLYFYIVDAKLFFIMLMLKCIFYNANAKPFLPFLHIECLNIQPPLKFIECGLLVTESEIEY